MPMDLWATLVERRSIGVSMDRETKHIADPRNATVEQLIQEARYHRIEAACSEGRQERLSHLRHMGRFIQLLNDKEV